MNANATQTVLIGRNLVKNFGTVEALVGVDITVPAGQSMAVMGPSGSDESTLLHCLSGILPVTSGEVTVNGTSITGLNNAGRLRLQLKAFEFVFQDDQLVPKLPASESAALPLILTGASHRSAIKKTNSWLTKVRLESERRRRPGGISGGQAQRVAVARALASSPSVIFADEPVSTLGQATGHEIMQILMTTARIGGATLVVVTHDPNVAIWCDRLIGIRDGRIHADTTAKGARS